MEKRNRNRYGKRLLVKFGKERPEHLGFTGDVSLAGLFIKTSTVFHPGTHLKIALELPDRQVIPLTGQVMWAKQVPASLLRITKKSGMGVRLTEAGEDYKRFVNRLSAGAVKGDDS